MLKKFFVLYYCIVTGVLLTIQPALASRCYITSEDKTVQKLVEIKNNIWNNPDLLEYIGEGGSAAFVFATMYDDSTGQFKNVTINNHLGSAIHALKFSLSSKSEWLDVKQFDTSEEHISETIMNLASIESFVRQGVLAEFMGKEESKNYYINCEADLLYIVTKFVAPGSDWVFSKVNSLLDDIYAKHLPNNIFEIADQTHESKTIKHQIITNIKDELAIDKKSAQNRRDFLVNTPSKPWLFYYDFVDHCPLNHFDTNIEQSYFEEFARIIVHKTKAYELRYPNLRTRHLFIHQFKINNCSVKLQTIVPELKRRTELYPYLLELFGQPVKSLDNQNQPFLELN